MIPMSAAGTISQTQHIDPESLDTFDSSLWNFWEWVCPTRDLAKVYFTATGALVLLASLRWFLKAMEGNRP